MTLIRKAFQPAFRSAFRGPFDLPYADGDPILALFANGEQGAYYDPSDSSTVFQDAAMTTPAGADDPVGAIMDKSGNGNHLTQSTAALRPALRNVGGLWYLEFDGTDDFLTRAAILSGTQTAVMAGATRRDLSDSEPAIMQGVAGGGRALYYPTRTAGDGKMLFVGGLVTHISTPVQDTNPHVYSWVRDGTAIDMRFDGAAESFTGGTATAHDETQPFRVGSRDAVNSAAVNIYGLIVASDLLTSGEVDTAESWLAEKSGVTL